VKKNPASAKASGFTILLKGQSENKNIRSLLIAHSGRFGCSFGIPGKFCITSLIVLDEDFFYFLDHQ
jgi:hypothetical protein